MERLNNIDNNICASEPGMKIIFKLLKSQFFNSTRLGTVHVHVYYTCTGIIIPRPRTACERDTVVVVLVSVCVCVYKSFKLCALIIDIYILKQKWFKANLFSASTVCCLCRKMFCWQRNCSFFTFSRTVFSCHFEIFDTHAYCFNDIH